MQNTGIPESSANSFKTAVASPSSVPMPDQTGGLLVADFNRKLHRHGPGPAVPQRVERAPHDGADEFKSIDNFTVLGNIRKCTGRLKVEPDRALRQRRARG